MMKILNLYLLLISLVISGVITNSPAQTLPTGVTVEPFYDITQAGLSFSEDELTTMGMVEVPGKPMHFVVLGYYGFVWTLYPDTTKNYGAGEMMDYSRREVANFNAQIMKGWEQGAIAGAFDAHFKDNRYFYIIFQRYSDPSKYHEGLTPNGDDGPGNTGDIIVERWIFNENYSEMNRDTTIISIPHGTGYGTHNMVIGKDNMMYISLDSYSKNSWDLSDLQRKILRLDVSRQDPGLMYGIPTDNPFYDSPDENIRKEIWAYGFRNTWSIASDYLTGSLWGAEVGQVTWEEVNIIEAGGNYGWANGGDGSGGGVGIEGPCTEISTDGGAFVYGGGGPTTPYEYTGDLSGNQTYDCTSFKRATWAFTHSGNPVMDIPSALPGTPMNCIIMGPAIRGDPSSPFYGYHFVTDIGRNYFIALKEGVESPELVGNVPESWNFSGDKNHNGIVSFSEDSYGNQYIIMASSSSSGSWQWHDIYRISHPEMTPLAEPRDQVIPVAIRLPGRAWDKANENVRVINLNYSNQVWVPKGISKIQLYSMDGRLIFSGNSKGEEHLALPRHLKNGTLVAEYLK